MLSCSVRQDIRRDGMVGEVLGGKVGSVAQCVNRAHKGYQKVFGCLMIR